MLTSNNGFQTKAQKNQLLKETLKKQLADPSYWYKTSAQQQLDKIEQNEVDALWVKNNPNASLAELMYPSMRKSSTQTETNKNTNSDFNTNQASTTNLNKPLLAENNSALNRGEQGSIISQNNSSRTTSGSTTGLSTDLTQTIGGMQKSVQSVKTNNTKAQGTGAENGTNLQRLSAVAQASEAIGAVNKPLGTLTNILGLAGELKSQSPQATTAKTANTQSIGAIEQQNTKQANAITQTEQIAQNAVNSVDPQQYIEQFDNNQALETQPYTNQPHNNQADDENKPTPLTEEYYNEITNGLPKISFQEMRNILGKMPMTKEEVVFLQKHPDWIEKILENNLDVTELMEDYAKLEPTSEELRLKTLRTSEEQVKKGLTQRDKQSATFPREVQTFYNSNLDYLNFVLKNNANPIEAMKRYNSLEKPHAGFESMFNDSQTRGLQSVIGQEEFKIKNPSPEQLSTWNLLTRGFQNSQTGSRLVTKKPEIPENMSLTDQFIFYSGKAVGDMIEPAAIAMATVATAPVSATLATSFAIGCAYSAVFALSAELDEQSKSGESFNVEKALGSVSKSLATDMTTLGVGKALKPLAEMIEKMPKEEAQIALKMVLEQFKDVNSQLFVEGLYEGEVSIEDVQKALSNTVGRNLVNLK